MDQQWGDPWIMRLFTLFLLVSQTVWAAVDIQVVVPVSSGGNDPVNSREAHFNWSFESESGADPTYGQYACGSWWVAPAGGDTGVRLLSLSGNDGYVGGETDWIALDDDPLPHAHGLLPYGPDIWAAAASNPNGYGKVYASNDAAQNDIGNLPLVYTPGGAGAISLVSCMQRNEPETSLGGTSQIFGAVADAYCVVTVVAAAPPASGADSIRPNIVGDSKQFLTWSDFDLTRLVSVSELSARTAGELSDNNINVRHNSEVFSMQTWDGDSFEYYSEGGRAFRGHLVGDDYAATQGSSMTTLIKWMFGQNTLAEKKPLLAALLAEGADRWHLMYGRASYPGAWISGAGQWSGQYAPAAFYAALLNDTTAANVLKKTSALTLGADTTLYGPQELQQIKRGHAGVPLWGDGHNWSLGESTLVNYQTTTYWTELLTGQCFDTATGSCSPGGGNRAQGDPHGYVDGPPAGPGGSYMGVTSFPFVNFANLMLLMPEFREIVGSDAPIEYVDRLLRVGVWTYPDPVQAPLAADHEGCDIYWQNVGDGCSSYRTGWGPTQSDIRFAVEGGAGRYISNHGNQIFDAGDLARAEVVNFQSWLSSLYDGYTYEDWQTSLGTCVPPEIRTYEESGTIYAAIWTPTIDAEIRYTLDGSEPSPSSALYSSHVAVAPGATVRAVAYKSGNNASRLTSWSTASGFVLQGAAGGVPPPVSPIVKTDGSGRMKLNSVAAGGMRFSFNGPIQVPSFGAPTVESLPVSGSTTLSAGSATEDHWHRSLTAFSFSGSYTFNTGWAALSPVVEFLDGNGASQIKLRLQADGDLELQQPDGTQIDATNDQPISADTAYTIAVSGTMGTGANASITVSVNGSPVITTSTGEWDNQIEIVRFEENASGSVTISSYSQASGE